MIPKNYRAKWMDDKTLIEGTPDMFTVCKVDWVYPDSVFSSETLEHLQKEGVVDLASEVASMITIEVYELERLALKHSESVLYQYLQTPKQIEDCFTYILCNKDLEKV